MFESLKEKLSNFVEDFSKKRLTEKDVEKFSWELETILIESDVALEVAEKVVESLKLKIEDKKIGLRESKKEILKSILYESIDKLFGDDFDFDKYVFERLSVKKPLVMLFIGMNGSGKTTTIAKMAYRYLRAGLSVVFAAADTFRAAGIEQLEEHGRKLKVKTISHVRGADPAAVAFDAIEHAKAHRKSIVMIDTAGRTEINRNLLLELEKIKRVTKPDVTIFVGDALTGNAAVEQAKRFNNAVGIDYIILAKMDVDKKGGSAISTSYVTGKKIIFVGTGQSYECLEPFKKEMILKRIFS